MKKTIVMSLIATLTIASLSGCTNTGNKNKIPLVSAMSQSELVDYYKTALSYDTIVTRKTDNVAGYEKFKVDEDTKNKLTKAQATVENQLAYMNYVGGSAMNENLYNYFKANIDDKILQNKKIKSVESMIGYYFVTVDYSFRNQSTGNFKDLVNYAGIHGGISENLDGTYSINQNYINEGLNKINEYKNSNKEIPTIKVQSTNNVEETVDNKVSNVRRPSIDNVLFNKVVGSAIGNTSFLPKLNYIYDTSSVQAGLAGFGIYPQGAYGLSEYGVDRNKFNGSIEVTYVFSDDIKYSDALKLEAIYVSDMKLDTGIKDIEEKDEALIPEFARVEIEKIIERADRAVNNYDIPALLGGEIYTDLGAGVSKGNYVNSVYLQQYKSKLNKVLERNGNSYLVDVETSVQDEPKNNDFYAAFRDKYIMLIVQDGDTFKIKDYVQYSRELFNEPQLSLEDLTTKRLIALNLEGDISNKDKKAVKELMRNLYEQSTNRSLDGIYSCFNSNVNILSTENKEYLNSRLRNDLTREGADRKSVYNGNITEWMGGNDKQIEFIAEEIIEYNGKEKVLHLKNYYLVSNYEDKWVIDDIKNITYEVVSKEEVSSIIQTIK